MVNLVFILIFYKELKLATFDAGLAAALGFSQALIHYSLMTLVSVTAVASFEAVGSVLVVALMIAPPATAYMLTDRLSAMLGLSVLVGIVSAVLGYFLAHWLDASIAGSMATMTGVLFTGALLFAPQQGLIAQWLRRRRQKWQFVGEILLVHLANHEGTPEEKAENTFENLVGHMKWDPTFGERVVRYVIRHGLVQRVNDTGLALTNSGRELSQQVMLR